MMSNYLKSALLIQKVYRRYRLSSKWRVLLARRKYGVAVLQRTARRMLAYKVARGLRAQQNSEWEQLWYPTKSLLYYYNHVTKKSQYSEPEGPFRPLVRDRLSAALIQAWPEIDNRRGVNALVPGNCKPVLPGTLCEACKVRRCVRQCWHCPSEEYYDAVNQAYVFPYCFACHVKEHGENGDKVDHEFKVIGEEVEVPDSVAMLRCCMCEEPSTRKCMGSLDEHQVDEICHQLKRAKLKNWQKVLIENNVGGEKKLKLLLEQLFESEGAVLEEEEEDGHQVGSPITAKRNTRATAAQLQSVRSMLEQIRAECDECYCASCYKEVHSGGRRSTHKWKGHRTYCPICVVCGASAAESECLDCQSLYCDSCCKVFHSMGRKKRHKQRPYFEPLGEGLTYCRYCNRRAADTSCTNEGCERVACDSCLEFVHKDKDRCAKEMIEDAALRNTSRSGRLTKSVRGLPPPSIEKGGGGGVGGKKLVRPGTAPTPDYLCAVCEEPADCLCVQCGDFYCSKVWMGNPGCFAKAHPRGNRATHTLQPLPETTTTMHVTGSSLHSNSLTLLPSKSSGGALAKKGKT